VKRKNRHRRNILALLALCAAALWYYRAHVMPHPGQTKTAAPSAPRIKPQKGYSDEDRQRLEALINEGTKHD